MKNKYIRGIIIITSILIFSYNCTSCSNVVNKENNNDKEIIENIDEIGDLNNNLDNDIIIEQDNNDNLNEEDNSKLI